MSNGPTESEPERLFYNKHSKNWWGKDSDFLPLLAYNKLRIPFIEAALNHVGINGLQGTKILDVGCGGGYLSENLALRGALVTGIDIASDLLEVAKKHGNYTLETYPGHHQGLRHLNYHRSTITEFVRQHKEAFDLVVSSEVIEHVENPRLFMEGLASAVKPNGGAVLTTPNRTWLSYMVLIVGAEYIMRYLPIGTHEHHRFIRPSELEELGKQVGFQKTAQQGVFYFPKPFNKWITVPFSSVLYMMSFRKLPPSASQ